MMRLMYLTLAIALGVSISAVSVQTDGNASAKAQTVAGVVKVVSVSSLTLARGRNEIVFSVDPSTRVTAKGLYSDLVYRTPGPRITDIVKAGQQVTITYRQSGRALNAVEVRVHK